MLEEDEYSTPILQSLESASLVRSFLGEYPKSLSYSFRLLRVGSIVNEDLQEIVHGLVNLRILLAMNACHSLASSVYFLWNLQTLFLRDASADFVCEIWKMPQLRHVIADGGMAYCVSDPLSDEEDMVLENLHTLFCVKNLKFGEGVLKRIPNIRMLKLYYERKIDGSRVKEGEDYYDLRNVCRLHKLETLKLQCHNIDSHLMREVSFPYSLKKLALVNTKLPWEDMNTKIGSLPLLQVLKLKKNSFIGSEWETSEDQFLNLKFLLIESCYIDCWITDNAHFPRLEHLVLRSISELEEIPSCMGDIPTLHSITVYKCSDSVVEFSSKNKG
ncbi:putative late blight resistance protein homolog R1B-16 [Salvia hispanica]|uniref:putative late blight resistance protein homolog R1B-16 n=1 Tax=Salvia hispanica TaxID=49212 RepID=UPI002009923E|nr:putative late blight resistance protein homolog R1B-16 [Salvia hispanica]XP_047977776.1 putative late blight resistance protein homolog R1B-16 [Salvia hispanica]